VTGAVPVWRVADPTDAEPLRDLERRANLVGLAHVFGARPFPDDAVLARWRATLDEPGVRVEVVDRPSRLQAVAAYDGQRLRTLAVDPARWGEGLGAAGVARAVVAIRARGAVPTLWCLAANHRARALYARLGWRRTGAERPAPWPPYPVEQEHRLDPVALEALEALEALVAGAS